MNDTAIEKVALETGTHGLELTSVESMHRFGQAVIKSGLAPSHFDTPEKILIAVQTGMEAGLKPMAALRSIIVINRMPAWKGDAALGLIRSSGKMKQWQEPAYTGTPHKDDWTCTVASERFDIPGVKQTSFSIADAKKAGLYPGNAQSPWTKYPKRMIYYRSLGFHARDHYSDVLMGLAIAEEVQDYQVAAVGATNRIEGPPETDKFIEAQTETVAPEQFKVAAADMTNADFDNMANEVPVGDDKGDNMF
jgi:hypothetical protein